MGAICCLEKAWLPFLQGSSQNDDRRGQTISKVLKREEVRQIKILEVQEWSFYWWRFKCAVELNANLYKNLHSTELQKSKRRLLSQKLGCSETTRADLKNRKDASFLKSWATQRPRGPISEIEEALAFSASSAPVTCTLSFAEITGNLSKISGEVESTRILLFNHHSPHAPSTPRVPYITLPKCFDKVKTREAGSSHYIDVTKKGKGIALLLVIRKSLYTSTSLLNGQTNLQKCSTVSRIRECTLNITSRNTQLYFPPIIPQQISHTKNKSISYHQGRKQEYPISCFLPVLVFVLVHTCRTKRKGAVSRNLKSNLQSGTDCLRPLSGYLLSIAIENSSSTAVKVMNSTGTYLMIVDQILALYTEAAKRG
ncbi:hypothetical protein ACFX1R_000926 [Malus domestica]